MLPDYEIASPLRTDPSPDRPVSPICQEHSTPASGYESDESSNASVDSEEAAERTPRAGSPVQQVVGPVMNRTEPTWFTHLSVSRAAPGYDADQSSASSDQVVSRLTPTTISTDPMTFTPSEPVDIPTNQSAVKANLAPEPIPQQTEDYDADVSSNNAIELSSEQEEYFDAKESSSDIIENWPLQSEGYGADVSSACESSPERRRTSERPCSPQAKAASFEKCIRSNGSKVDMYRADSTEKRFLRVAEKGQENGDGRG